jgi:2,3-dihydroxybiphenyl 1,2-dioxygenase
VELTALGYMGLTTTDLEDWNNFATDLLGMQQADRTSTTLALRVDDRAQRFLISTTGDVPRYFGWEVTSAESLDRLSNRLDAAGIAHRPLTGTETAERAITAGLAFADPDGNRVECFHGAHQASTAFLPGREISGFRTGDQGLGHAVLTTPQAEVMIHFYQDVLGFRLSDYQLHPFTAYFFHLNQRHHSLAIIGGKHIGVHHVMVETLNLDDVGQAYDLALAEGNRVSVTLGRHSNDNMFSFYSRTPSGFLLEYGWGGRCLDVENWQAEELTVGPSLWGHERDWLPPEGRAEAYRMRVQAARDGYRAPIHVYGDNYDTDPASGLWRHLNK